MANLDPEFPNAASALVGEGGRPTTWYYKWFQKLQRRLKLFMYGEPGVGKTIAAVQFPHSYIIDGERGTDHYGSIIRASNSVVLQTTSHNEVIDQLRALLSEDHPYRTLVIDPISTIYSDLLDECEHKVGDSNARHFGEAQKHMKRVANLMTAQAASLDPALFSGARIALID